jgi:hypothetical protein
MCKCGTSSRLCGITGTLPQRSTKRTPKSPSDKCAADLPDMLSGRTGKLADSSKARIGNTSVQVHSRDNYVAQHVDSRAGNLAAYSRNRCGNLADHTLDVADRRLNRVMLPGRDGSRGNIVATNQHVHRHSSQNVEVLSIVHRKTSHCRNTCKLDLPSVSHTYKGSSSTNAAIPSDICRDKNRRTRSFRTGAHPLRQALISITSTLTLLI